MGKAADAVAQFLPSKDFRIMSANSLPTLDGGTIVVLVTYNPPEKPKAT